MKSAKLVSLGVALALALGILMYNTIGVSADPTAVLTTPPLPSNADQFMQCYIVNVSSATKTVTVQVINSAGTIKGSNAGLVLGPGQGSGLAISGTQGGYYCRFLVDRADFYRASIAVMGEPLAASGQGTLISSLPAW